LAPELYLGGRNRPPKKGEPTKKAVKEKGEKAYTGQKSAMLKGVRGFAGVTEKNHSIFRARRKISKKGGKTNREEGYPTPAKPKRIRRN